jgi:glycine hydroxymethyltransferase
VAKAVGAIFMVDMAHYAGLIAAGVYPNPVPHADVVTSTTHKSLRGPRGGIVLMNDEDDRQEDQQRHLPRHPGRPADARHRRQGGGLQGSAGARPSRSTSSRWWPTPAVLAETLIERGLRIVSGRTESHVMLVDLRPKGLTGKEAEAMLGEAHMTCNKNGIPNDPQKPMVTSGIRLGTPAMTTRGFKEEQARQTAHLIADVLDNPRDAANIAAVRAKVAALTRDFPVYR